jgi:hypothetical protein
MISTRFLVGLATAVVVVTTVSASLSSIEKSELLQAHNYYRSSVYPLATNMVKLEWDEDLARLAQYYSANCEYMRNEHRHDQSEDYDYVGENIAATANYTYNLTRMVQTWWAGQYYYDYSTAYCGDDEEDNNKDKRNDDKEEFDECQSYTQMVWAETYKVGCGAFRCSELRMYEEGDYGAMLLICNYGPGGAYQGLQPYSTGSEPCSGCPSGKNFCTNNLCTGGAIATTTYTWLVAVMVTVVAALQLSS